MNKIFSSKEVKLFEKAKNLREEAQHYTDNIDGSEIVVKAKFFLDNKNCLKKTIAHPIPFLKEGVFTDSQYC